MKTAYAATFANGKTATRKSEREYSHAWRAEITRADGTVLDCGGFAGSRELADAAARAWVNGATGRATFSTYTTRPRGKYARFASPAYFQHTAKTIAEQGGKDAWDAKIREREATAKIEIVATVRK